MTRMPALFVGHGSPMNALPAPDHFIPLLYLAGVAAAEGKVEPLVRGYSLGSLSMTGYGVGAEVRLAQDPAAAAGLPEHLPADQTNIWDRGSERRRPRRRVTRARLGRAPLSGRRCGCRPSRLG